MIHSKAMVWLFATHICWVMGRPKFGTWARSRRLRTVIDRDGSNNGINLETTGDSYYDLHSAARGRHFPAIVESGARTPRNGSFLCL